MKKQLLFAALAALTLGTGLQAGPLFDKFIKKEKKEASQVLASLILALKTDFLLEKISQNLFDSPVLGSATQANTAFGPALASFIAVSNKISADIPAVVDEITKEARESTDPIATLSEFYAKAYKIAPKNKKGTNKLTYGDQDTLPEA